MPKPLTSEEVLKVQLATRGESFSHRRWPAEVVKALASADVITGREVKGCAGGGFRLFGRVLLPPLLSSRPAGR